MRSMGVFDCFERFRFERPVSNPRFKAFWRHFLLIYQSETRKLPKTKFFSKKKQIIFVNIKKGRIFASR